MNGTNNEPTSEARESFRNIFVQLLVQPVEVVEGDELEIKGWGKDEKEFAEKLVESACCIANAKGGAVLGGIEGKQATFSKCPYPNVSSAWIETRVKDQSYPPAIAHFIESCDRSLVDTLGTMALVRSSSAVVK